MICHSNDYEQAFASWLTENGVYHVAVDQARRAQLARSRIKTFDFLLYPADRTQFCAGDRITFARRPHSQVKGRRFKVNHSAAAPPSSAGSPAKTSRASRLAAA